MRILLLLTSFATAQINTCKFPLACSGGTISHVSQDGTDHIPKTYGAVPGSVLTTQGGSKDEYWGAPGVSDSTRAAHIADTVKHVPNPDSSRVSGLSDSAKALVRYAMITTLHDTADTLRAYTRNRIHDSLNALTPARIGAAPAFSSGAGNLFWATPNGSAGSPGFRAIAAPDIPILNQNTTGSATYFTDPLFGDVTGTQYANTVTSILHKSIPAWANGVLRYNGGVISWDNSVWDITGAAGRVWMSDGISGPNGFRFLAAGDIPSLDASKTTTGTFADSQIASAATWNAKEPSLGSSTGIQALFSNGSLRFWNSAPYLGTATNNTIAMFSGSSNTVSNSSLTDGSAGAAGVYTTGKLLGVQHAASNTASGGPGLYMGTATPGTGVSYWEMQLNTSDGLDFWGTGNAVRANLSSSGIWASAGYSISGGTSSQLLRANGTAATLAGSDVTTALGYTPANATALASYLPLSAGFTSPLSGYLYLKNITGTYGLIGSAPSNGSVFTDALTNDAIIDNTGGTVRIGVSAGSSASTLQITSAGATITGNATVSGTTTPTGGIVGKTDGSSAASGIVGQVISSYIPASSAVGLTAGVGGDITTITLSAGDWDVSGNIVFSPPLTGSPCTGLAFIGTASTITTDGSEGATTIIPSATNYHSSAALPTRQWNVSGSTTLHLYGYVTSPGVFTQAYGFVSARRIR